MPLIVIGGIQGAGKSTLADEIVKNGIVSDLLNVNKGSAVHLDVDAYYKKDLSKTSGVNMDYEVYYSDIATNLSAGKDVIITTSPTSIRLHLKKIAEKLGNKFSTKMIFIDCPLEQAKDRIRTRSEKGGHGIDQQITAILDSLYKRIPDFLKQVKDDGISIFQAEFELGKTPTIKQLDDRLLTQSSQKERF